MTKPWNPNYNYETPHWCHVFIYNHFPLKDDFRSRVFLLTVEWFLALFFHFQILFCFIEESFRASDLCKEATLLYSFTLWLIHLIMIDTLHSSVSSYLSIDSWHFVSLCLQVQPPTLPPYRPQFHNFFTSPRCSGALHTHLCNGPMQPLSVLPLVLPRHMLL